MVHESAMTGLIYRSNGCHVLPDHGHTGWTNYWFPALGCQWQHSNTLQQKSRSYRKHSESLIQRLSGWIRIGVAHSSHLGTW
jgi:hypothetical protein